MNIVATLHAKAIVNCLADGDIAWSHSDFVPLDVIAACESLLRERGLYLVHEVDVMRVAAASRSQEVR